MEELHGEENAAAGPGRQNLSGSKRSRGAEEQRIKGVEERRGQNKIEERGMREYQTGNQPLVWECRRMVREKFFRHD
jgi:hypothetical protein